MSDNPMIDGWHSTDDEVAVPVRSSAQAPAPQAPSAGPAHDISYAARADVHIPHDQTPPNPRAMTMSAVLGVLLAIGGVVSYLGLDSITGSLTGDLTGGASSELTITITQEGDFSPNSLDIRPGDTVTIVNENPDPQVIKSKTGQDLFPVQVIFDEPYTFTVPADAAGTYVYHSETLPEDKMVAFTVVSGALAQVSSSASATDNIIPLPFGGDPIVSGVQSSSSVSVKVEPTAHSGDAATISLGGSSSGEETVVTGNSEIPTNPYTVANGLTQEALLPAAAIASSAASEETLHGGAPIRELIRHTPRSVTATGPAGAMLLLLPALGGVIIAARRRI
jgi:plastocyanin